MATRHPALRLLRPTTLTRHDRFDSLSEGIAQEALNTGGIFQTSNELTEFVYASDLPSFFNRTRGAFQPRPQIMSFTTLIERIRTEQHLSREVPDVDPSNGNEQALFLFVLEAPGPQAIASGFVSLNNNDQTARNLRNQLEAAGVDAQAIALWNVVPWYLGNADKTRIRSAISSDVKQGLAYLSEAITMMPRLECIVLVGGAARQAHIHLSSRTKARILSCHHPSPRVQNTNPDAAAENIKVFRHMAIHLPPPMEKVPT